MPADLKRIYDHPANVLASVEPDYGNAIAYLRYYEDTNGVTFAALDTNNLIAIRDAYRDVRTYGHDESMRDHALEDLANLVGSLLGLDDA